MIAHIGVKSGVIERRPVINGRGEIRPVKATHGLRKAFQTTAINAGMSPLYSEILMGQKELEFKSNEGEILLSYTDFVTTVRELYACSIVLGKINLMIMHKAKALS